MVIDSVKPTSTLSPKVFRNVWIALRFNWLISFTGFTSHPEKFTLWMAQFLGGRSALPVGIYFLVRKEPLFLRTVAASRIFLMSSRACRIIPVLASVLPIDHVISGIFLWLFLLHADPQVNRFINLAFT